jgi:hypothetical protein
LSTLAVCALAPAAATAQSATEGAPTSAPESRAVDGSFEITFAGFSGFRIDFTARFDGAHYDVESHTFKEGLLKAVTMNYEGRNRAWGSFTPQGARPAGGSLAIMVSHEPRTWLVYYGPDGSLRETATPPWSPAPKDAIPDDKKRGSLDPLSASLAVGMAGDAACDQVAPSNDGRRRIDIQLQKLRTETPAQAGLPQVTGDVLVCAVSSKRIAGQFFDQPDESEAKRDDPMVMWLARLQGSTLRYPVRLEAKTTFGTIRGKVLYFRERPLTDEEKAAMPR